MAPTAKNKRLTRAERKLKASEWWWSQVEAAPTPGDRVARAIDYLKAALHKNDGPEAAQASTEIAVAILERADQLMGVKRR